MFPEGFDSNSDKMNSFFEFRCDGPYNKPLANGCFRSYIEINILMTCKRDPNNIYKKENMQGIAAPNA
jgi:hypothetical protein